jgi:hypothetical protein
MFKKITTFLLSKKTENRLRRILELAVLGSGICTICCADYMSTATVGLIAVLIAFKGLTEDLPRVGALNNSRRFWE